MSKSTGKYKAQLHNKEGKRYNIDVIAFSISSAIKKVESSMLRARLSGYTFVSIKRTYNYEN